MPNEHYPRLFSPISIGGTTLKNRVIMGSIHTRLENEPDAETKLAAFYRERARGGVGLIITGGVSPNFEGRVEEGAHVLESQADTAEHKSIIDAVHAEGGKIALQILHTGIYAKHPEIVGPGDTPSPINHRVPRQLSSDEVDKTVDDFVRCAELAREAGYDAIELMGSEGYLICQFTAPRTNQREDEWGGSLENRIRFPLEIVRRTRARLGKEFPIIFRISAIDLVEGGLTGEEIDLYAKALEQAGVDLLDIGVGWHESIVPTIATSVPRAAFAFAARRLKQVVTIPVVASNRINMPAVAEGLLERGDADMVSMARPFLADPEFVVKAQSGRTDEINTCIGCNQACLDHIFTDRLATCLVNPRACHETDLNIEPASVRRKVAVIGSGPAGLACAATAAERGHAVTLFESADDIGGQLNVARRIPGKEQEFSELIRYFRKRLEKSGTLVKLGVRAEAESLKRDNFDRVVVATGIRPRTPEIDGIDSPKVVSYLDVILGRVEVGDRVAIIGTGGIGHDVAELLTAPHQGEQSADEFFSTWGVDQTISDRGGLCAPAERRAVRTVTLLQRTFGKPSKRLGKSTGWIHRAKLNKRGVATLIGCTYHRIDEEGLHYSVDGDNRLLPVDTVVLCAGQDPEQSLAESLQNLGIQSDLIGGARFASELDAKRAIDEGTRLACTL
ncbi:MULTISPECIES: oxidoreductase [Paraburkholderia]|jgi:2,4-dienoyl-CoA reductase (NADPH2)|uniref:oxidoreductase n=1 Tax=Paraburkholderia TaxID=1822464 RepID=UPI0038BA8534